MRNSECTSCSLRALGRRGGGRSRRRGGGRRGGLLARPDPRRRMAAGHLALDDRARLRARVQRHHPARALRRRLDARVRCATRRRARFPCAPRVSFSLFLLLVFFFVFGASVHYLYSYKVIMHYFLYSTLYIAA